jgi:hypothetical protein
MGRLIPKVPVDEISNKPERDVARALVESLPNDCVIYHGYPWLKTERHDKGSVLKEGETDFVIVVPSHGLLVLEVKGGEIEFDPQSMCWYRRLESGAQRDIRDPFWQARRNLYYLRDRCIEVGYQASKKVPFVYGYAVIFPDCVYQGPAPPGAEPAIILGSSDLALIDRRVKSALRQWNPSGQDLRIEKEDQEIIQRAISPSFQLLPVLFRRIEEEAEKIFQLTEDQKQLLEFLANRKRAAIEGVAGSGKTLLAIAQAQRFASQGKKTLIVCFNRNLADWIEMSLPESFEKLIVVRNYHRLCFDLCREAGVNFAPPPSWYSEGQLAAFWQEEVPELLLKASEKNPDQFDAIVVDEAQDFHEEWILTLELLNKESDRGSLYVFYDPAQQLYIRGPQQLPSLGEPFVLPVNCRNTRKVADYCGKFRGVEMLTRGNAPEGEDPYVVSVKDGVEQAKKIVESLKEWVNIGKLRPSQIAILSPARLNKMYIFSQGHIANIPITENLNEWREDHGVLFSTIRTFKGLEADAVLLIGMPLDRLFSQYKNDHYVACSRAKHRLHILMNLSKTGSAS